MNTPTSRTQKALEITARHKLTQNGNKYSVPSQSGRRRWNWESQITPGRFEDCSRRNHSKEVAMTQQEPWTYERLIKAPKSELVDEINNRLKGGAMYTYPTPSQAPIH